MQLYAGLSLYPLRGGFMRALPAPLFVPLANRVGGGGGNPFLVVSVV